MAGDEPLNVAFVGLGAMGCGMAAHLVKLGHNVTGYDLYQPSMERLRSAGGNTSSSPKDAAAGKDFLICMVASSKQAESILFNKEDGAVQALPTNATIIICSTVPAAYLGEISTSLEKMNRNDIFLVDSPVSGGTARAGQGSLTILSSGSTAALDSGKRLLADLSEKLYIIPGGIGAASNVKMVNQLLAGVHIAAAAEAMGLAAVMQLNTQLVYDIIISSVGNSWMFENRVPHMLANDWTPHSALDIFVKDMGIVTSSAREHTFPLPLSSAAEQLYLSASSQGFGREDDAGLVRVFIPNKPTAVYDMSQKHHSFEQLTPQVTPEQINNIGFLGFDSTGLEIAASLLKAGFSLRCYDTNPSLLQTLGDSHSVARSPADASTDVQVLVLTVSSVKRVEDILFGNGKAVKSLPNGAVVVLTSTFPPSFIRGLQSRLVGLGRNIELVDAPVSEDGQIVASANTTSISRVESVLAAMSGPEKNLHLVEGGVGTASSINLIIQLLASVHVAAAAEAMFFGAKLGLDTKALYEIIKNAAGGSWMFGNRVPAMLKVDRTPSLRPKSFRNNLNIVLDETKRLLYPATLTATVHPLYLSGTSRGWDNEADGGIIQLWELLTGVSVWRNAQVLNTIFKPAEYPKLPKKSTIDGLPQEHAGNTLEFINEGIQSKKTPILVVLDDDPTGTQTCHDIAVLTVWDHDTLCSEFRTEQKGFFILTNSRAFPPTEAKQLISTICSNVAKAAKETDTKFEIVLRGDSTLRGHFPDEPEAVEEVLGRVDNWILAPFFFQGGRYTISDVHYVAEGDVLVPAGQTPFAEDATFGYKSSNLRDYVLEKAGRRFTNDDFVSISIEDIRHGGPKKVEERLLSAPAGSVIIVNSAAESDMFIFAAGVLAAEQAGKKYIYRTGAAFVSCRLGISPIPPLSVQDLKMDLSTKGSTGGLIIAGSYVPKTTAQLAYLRSQRGSKLHVIELDVSKLIDGSEESNQLVQDAIKDTTAHITAGDDVLVMTSRTLIVGEDEISSLKIGSAVAEALVRVVQNIEVRPRYVIAKGGITSSDAATKGLKMKRAMVVGQAAPGVPIWRCNESTSRHIGVPYVVFPGNVGEENALAGLVERWSVDNV